jgi:autotransporter-associated beta strand protein
VQNDTTGAVPVTIAQGTTANGIDLDASIIFSNGGTNANFTKLGSGTLRLTNSGNTASFSVNAGRLRTDTIANLGSGTITLNGGTYTYGGSTASTNKAFPVTANSGIEILNAATNLTFNGSSQINFNSSTLTKSGPGTLTLSGSNLGTSSAGTTVAAGLLNVTVNDALPIGSTLTVQNGATANISASPAVLATVNAGGTMLGAGGIGSGGELHVSGTISPGATPGAISGFNVGGPVTFQSGGTYVADTNSLPGSGVAGTNWDTINAADTLGGSATSSARFNIIFNAQGTIAGFDNTQSYSWPIVAVGNSSTFDSTAFTVTAGSGWTGANALGSGTFEIFADTNSVNVVFSPVPEPGLMLGLTVLVGLGVRRWRANRHVGRPDPKE